MDRFLDIYLIEKFHVDHVRLGYVFTIFFTFLMLLFFAVSISVVGGKNFEEPLHSFICGQGKVRTCLHLYELNVAVPTNRFNTCMACPI